MEWHTLILPAVISVYTLYREVTTYNKVEHTEADGLSERIKDLYKEENGALIARIEKVESENKKILAENKAMKTSLEKMFAENQRFLSYVERRDPDDIAYRQRGEQIFNVVEKVVPLIISTNESMGKLVALLETHFKPLQDVKPAEKVEKLMSKGGDVL